MMGNVVVSFSHDVKLIGRLSTSDESLVVLTNYISPELRLPNCDYYWFDDFIPIDFDDQLNLEGRREFDLLIKVMAFPDFVKDYSVEDARFHFINKVVRIPLLYRLAIKGFVSNLKPGSKLFYSSDMEFCIDSSRQSALVVRVLKFVAYGIYEYLCLPLLSRIFYFRTDLDCSKTIVIGNLNELNGILSLPEMTENDRDVLNLFPMRRFFKLRKFLGLAQRVQHIPLERLISITGIFRCFISYFRYFVKLNSVIGNIRGGGVLSVPLVSVYGFFLYFGSVAIKYKEAASYVLPRYDCDKIYFSYPHTWQINRLNKIFKNSGFLSVTSTHGLIQEPLLMTSQASFCYAFNKYDAKLLKKFSDDDEIIYLPPSVVCSQGFKISDVNGRIIKVLVLGKLFYSDAPPHLSCRYFDIIKSAIEVFGSDYEFEVFYRPHPREPALLGKTVSDSFGSVFSGFEIRPFDSLINHYDLFITPSSTALVDLVQRGAPVLTYSSGYDSESTFFSAFPKVLKFNDSSSLVDLIRSRIKGRIDYKNLYDAYLSVLFSNN